ncbi:hypothetical protein [Agrobacterium deltaense]|uniref:hypothetical protein n=1 Tax=Agrobacterium deltaense TaxID=1183412 RepID=UPI001C6EE799|nr:hypothetical protein [Agrobacterium deltaense]
MRYFYLVLATAFGLSFAWSVAVAKDKPVQQPAAASAYEWIEAERGFILVKHEMTPVSSFE